MNRRSLLKVTGAAIVPTTLAGCSGLFEKPGSQGTDTTDGQLNLGTWTSQGNEEILYMEPEIEIPAESTVTVNAKTDDTDWDEQQTTVEEPISPGSRTYISAARVDVELAREVPPSPSARYTRAEVDNGLVIDVEVETPEGETYTETLEK